MTENNKVLAKVNGREITQSEVMEFISMMGPQGAQFSSPEGIQKIADELVNQELIYSNAKKNKLDENPDFIKELEKVKESTLKQFAIGEILKNVVISEEDINDFYNSHLDNFKKPVMMNASHILVDSEEKAISVKEEIAAGKSFEDAALEYSSCPSKDKGGNLGQFSQGQMVPEFENAALNAEVGKVSDPVKTQFGYHLIKLVSKTDEAVADLEDVKSQIINQLTAMKQQEMYLTKVAELAQEYEVEKFY